MEKRYQIRVGTHKVDFRYDADTQTWRARRPGTQDYTTGQAGTLEAARDAVRRYIQDEEPTGESLHPRASPARYRDVRKTVPVSASGESARFRSSARQEAAGKGDRGKNPFPAEAGKGARRDFEVTPSRNPVQAESRQRPASESSYGRISSRRLPRPGRLRELSPRRVKRRVACRERKSPRSGQP